MNNNKMVQELKKQGLPVKKEGNKIIISNNSGKK